MDPLDYLSVRFHFRGTFEWIGGDWVYKGGRCGYSTVLLSKLSIAELKIHLGDHVSISDEAMQKTVFCWRIPVGPDKTALVQITDKRSVASMARHVTDAGVIDLYAKIPNIDPVDSSDEDNVHQKENAPMQHDHNREENAQHQQASAVKLPKGSKLSRKGTKMTCSMCGGGNHNKRKCTANPDAVRDHSQQAKAAKRSRKRQEKSTEQQAQAHVLQPAVQKSAVQLPQKKKYKKKPTAEGASSQSSAIPTQGSQASTGVHVPRYQQIPMSQVVTEPVPKSGRMSWYLNAGKDAQDRQSRDAAE